MLWFCLLLSSFYTTQHASTEINYTASTPAGKTVRNFLGIHTPDSIEFIRWKLKVIDDKKFHLECSYGRTQPNTNGFANERKVEINGLATFHDGLLTLSHADQKLNLLQLNENVMHLLYADGSLMVGNGGWSYTLNAVAPTTNNTLHLSRQNMEIKDSVVFDGRTPCRGVDELLENKTRPECYKKKWRVTLYENGNYKIGPSNIRTGKWKIKSSVSGQKVYRLQLNNGNHIDLLRADENIVYFIDEQKGLMVGDQDFSYSLNRKDYTDH